MKTSDYTIYSIVAILLWIILCAVIIALILYFSWSAIIPNVMHYKLVIFENHTKSTSLDITPEQARQILGVTDYTPEQYEILAEITNRPASYFMDDLVDYYVDF